MALAMTASTLSHLRLASSSEQVEARAFSPHKNGLVLTYAAEPRRMDTQQQVCSKSDPLVCQVPA